MLADAGRLLQTLPGPVSDQWPGGARFVRALAHGSMSVELYAPVGQDPQQPHAQDELYFVQAGSAEIVIAGERHAVVPGTAIFVPAGVAHRFENFTPQFVTWAVFWGPVGGESPG